MSIMYAKVMKTNEFQYMMEKYKFDEVQKHRDSITG
jgi:hypothetical protein